MEQNVQRPTLVMIRGLPGSGKSHLAAALADRLGKGDVTILDPDTIDLAAPDYAKFSKALDREGLDKAIHPFRWSRKLACDAIMAHKIVIWNQPFTNRGIFERLVAFLEGHAHEHGLHLPVLVVEVEIDHETAKERIARRKQEGGHGPSDNTFAQRAGEYQSYADGFKTIVVQGADEVGVSLAAVLRALKELGQEAGSS